MNARRRRQHGRETTERETPESEDSAKDVRGPKDTVKADESKSESNGERNEVRAEDVAIDLRLIIATVLGFALRVWDIGYPPVVVWDEVHFGKFAVFYNTGRYFFDVHPPLAKMLLGFAGWLGNLGGDFLFADIGQDYEDSGVPYILMRLSCAMFGTAIVPLGYLILLELGCRRNTATMGALLLSLDNAQVAVSRYILLDTPLIFFTLLALYCALRFASHRNPFTASWFARLLAAGLSLGAVISVKYVGAFSVALIGLHTIRELWLKWSNLDVRMSAVAEHFAAYAVGLIVVPLCLYVGLFALHLHLLPLSGTGDTFMSPDFQASLQGNTMARRQEVLRDVHTGSLVMLMNEVHGNCWLHSHPYRYPIYPSGDENGLVSSYQQQVTCLELLGADEANWFRIEDATLPFNSSESAAAAPRPLRHFDLIRLVHATTGFALNSHDVAGPLTPQAQEVSCYGPGDERVPAGEPGHMPLSDMWRVELLGSNVDNNAPVRAIESRLRLTHISTSSALQITNKRLPDWGFGQLEVVTSRHALQSPESVWRVDDHWHPNATHKDPTIVRPRMSFWEQLIELHVEMFKANNNLLAEHSYGSRPWRWAALTAGLAFWHGQQGEQIFLLGNPLLWWCNLLAVCLYPILWLLHTLAGARRLQWVQEAELKRFFAVGRTLWLGWLLHYLPFFFMARQLFLHHYLPAAAFSTLLLAHMTEHIGMELFRRGWLYRALQFGIMATTSWSFYYFAPLTYGWKLTGDEVLARHWVSSWSLAMR